MQRSFAAISLAFAFSARALNRPVTAAAARVKRRSRDEEIKLADIAQRNGRRARRARAAPGRDVEAGAPLPRGQATAWSTR